MLKVLVPIQATVRTVFGTNWLSHTIYIYIYLRGIERLTPA